MSQPPQPVISYATPEVNRPLKFGRSIFGWILFIGLAVMLFLLLQKGRSTYTAISVGEFATQLQKSNVRYVDVDGDELVGQFRTPISSGNASVMKYRVPLPNGASANWALTQWLLDNANGAGVGVNQGSTLLKDLLLPLAPWLLIFGFIWFFVFRQLRRSAGTQPAQPTPVYVVNLPPGQQGT